MRETESAIIRHYTHGALEQAIHDGLRALGRDAGSATAEELAAVDEFHMGGPAATASLAEAMGLGAASADAALDRPVEDGSATRLLDIGSGLGGPARAFARRWGCAVTGIDLTPEYVAVAEALTRMAGLADRVHFRAGSATALPFADASFDAATLLHVGMNIADKARLCAEAARVLKPGGVFGVYDVMRVGEGALDYPVAWAADETTSFVAAPADYTRALAAAGFRVESETDRADMALALFRRMQARIAAGGPPPLGLHLLMGRDAAKKLANMVAGVARGVIAPVAMVARREARRTPRRR